MPALIVGGKIARENMANRVAGDVMCNVSLCIDLSAPQTLTVVCRVKRTCAFDRRATYALLLKIATF